MDSTWLINRLHSLRKTRSGLARALDLQPSAISRIINGQRKIQAGEIEPMARFLEVSQDLLLQKIATAPDDGVIAKILESDARTQKAEDLAREARLKDPYFSIETRLIDGEVQAARETGHGALPVWGVYFDPKAKCALSIEKTIDRVPRIPQLYNVLNAYAVYMPDESMAPRYNPGDTLYINPAKPLNLGCYCILFSSRSNEKDSPVMVFIGEMVGYDSEQIGIKQIGKAHPLFPPRPEGMTTYIKHSNTLRVHRIVGVAEK